MLLDPFVATAIAVLMLVLNQADALQSTGDHDRHAVDDDAARRHGDGLEA